MPQEFVEISVSSDYYFFSGPDSLNSNLKQKFLRNMDYGYISIDSSIFIGINYAPLNPRNDTARMFQALFPGRKVNNNYLLTIKHKVNSFDEVKFYDSLASYKLGVNISGEYSLNLFHKYLGIYSKGHVVFMQRNNAFCFEIFIFYKEFREAKVRKYIKHIDKIINFRKSRNW
ncbi:hypothetical protein GCM10027516_41740 [Niabella aquatica]